MSCLTGPCPLSICLSESNVNEIGHHPISCSLECVRFYYERSDLLTQWCWSVQQCNLSTMFVYMYIQQTCFHEHSIDNETYRLRSLSGKMLSHTMCIQLLTHPPSLSHTRAHTLLVCHHVTTNNCKQTDRQPQKHRKQKCPMLYWLVSWIVYI